MGSGLWVLIIWYREEWNELGIMDHSKPHVLGLLNLGLEYNTHLVSK